MTPFSTSAPGRLCLFGEHQDYLGLPVIAMAMNRRCHLRWVPRTDTRVVLTSEELGEVGGFDLAALDRVKAATPFEVVVAGLMAESAGMPPGMDIHIRSDIPIQAGCSSSTALLTAWTAGWSTVMNVAHSTEELVSRCHHAEVLAFDGAGGDMDHFACAHGGLHRFDGGVPEALPSLPGTFVLGDSGQPKDTQGHLARCRDARLPLMGQLDSPPIDWSEAQRMLAEGTRVNRDLEAEWADHMRSGLVDGAAMGQALTRHHAVLRDVLGLSTPCIEAMLGAALSAGAWGGKINGSGGGGCMFAHVPDQRVEPVIEAMLAAGAKGAWPVTMDEGVRHG